VKFSTESFKNSICIFFLSIKRKINDNTLYFIWITHKKVRNDKIFCLISANENKIKGFHLDCPNYCEIQLEKKTNYRTPNRIPSFLKNKWILFDYNNTHLSYEKMYLPVSINFYYEFFEINHEGLFNTEHEIKIIIFEYKSKFVSSEDYKTYFSQNLICSEPIKTYADLLQIVSFDGRFLSVNFFDHEKRLTFFATYEKDLEIKE